MHTGHDAKHLGPDDNVKEHCAPDKEEQERNPCPQRRNRRKEEDFGSFFLFFFFFLLEGARRRAERSRLRRCSSIWSFTTLSSSWSERRTNGTRRRVSSSWDTARCRASSSSNFSSRFTFCAFFSFSSLSFSSSSCFFFNDKFCSRRNRRVVKSTPSSPRSAGTTRRGASPAECRTVRSLRCGPGSKRLPGRTPGSGGFCARRPSCCSCSTSSLALAPVFGPRGAAFCCALWCVAAARAMRTVSCSCRHHERSRRSRRRLATPPAEGRTLDSAIISQLHVGKKEKQHGHKPG